MKEFDRFVKSLMQSLQAFSQLMEAGGENLEKNLEAPKAKVTRAAKPMKAARPARRATEPAKATVAAKPAKPAKVEKPKKPAKMAKPARRPPVVEATQSPAVKLRKKRALSEGATVVDTVLKMIENNPEGISTSTLKEKTGFDDRQIQNSVYRLKKFGKITAMGKGLYVPSVISEPVSEEPEPIRETVEAEA